MLKSLLFAFSVLLGFQASTASADVFCEEREVNLVEREFIFNRNAGYFGSIRIENIQFEKNVYVLYQDANDQFGAFPAHYSAPDEDCDGYERWTFYLPSNRAARDQIKRVQVVYGIEQNGAFHEWRTEWFDLTSFLPAAQ